MRHGPEPAFAPPFATQRLALARPTAGDFEEVRALAEDDSMFRYSERGPMTGEEAWSLLLRHIGHWAVAGFGVFTVRERESGRFAGLVGASTFERSLGGDFDPLPEMHWSIVPALRGRGYAVEAAEAALDWLARSRGERASVCLIHADNAASISVAERLGFAPLRRLHYRGYPALLMRRSA